MKARRVTNRKPPLVFFEPADVKSLSGYGEGRTVVYLKTGHRLHVEMPVEEVRAGLEAEQQDILRRGLDRALARRERHEREHPEFAHFWPLLEAVSDGLAEESQRREEADR